MPGFCKASYNLSSTSDFRRVRMTAWSAINVLLDFRHSWSNIRVTLLRVDKQPLSINNPTELSGSHAERDNESMSKKNFPGKRQITVPICHIEKNVFPKTTHRIVSRLVWIPIIKSILWRP